MLVIDDNAEKSERPSQKFENKSLVLMLLGCVDGLSVMTV